MNIALPDLRRIVIAFAGLVSGGLTAAYLLA